MGFIQIVEGRAKDPDALAALNDEYEKATAGQRTSRRALVCRDRNDPARHMIIVFFDSYESAMENSNLPGTQEMAQKVAALLDGPPTFHDLDIVDDRS